LVMAKFLNDKEVGGAIRKVMMGKDLRCAVAFWGDGAFEALFPSVEAVRSAHILCDLTMGGTNPHELERLGAPGNPQLKHVQGLHAKLYLSDAGLVVASANASNRGIGFVEVAALTECGTFHEPGTQAFGDAADWFADLWKDTAKAKPVGQDALEKAKSAWARRPRHGGAGHASVRTPDTLLWRIAKDPEQYRGIGVVFTSEDAKKKDVEAASKAAIEADDQRECKRLTVADRERLRNWPEDHLYFEWAEDEVDAWPGLFLGVHRGRQGEFSYWCYQCFVPLIWGNNSAIFAEISERLRKRLGVKESPIEVSKAEGDFLNRIFQRLRDRAGPVEGSGHMLCESPERLAALLSEVDGHG
jgi:hypothetical protein